MIKIARDKELHYFLDFFFGWSAGVISYVIFRRKYDNPALKLIVMACALGVSIIAAIGWELFWMIKKGSKFDWLDIAAGVIGGATAALIWFGFSFLPGFIPGMAIEY